jgi:hypothetical protein
MLYRHKLTVSSFEGEADGIKIEWSENARKRLNAFQCPKYVDTLKGLSEHFTFLAAKQLGDSKASILYGNPLWHFSNIS